MLLLIDPGACDAIIGKGRSLIEVIEKPIALGGTEVCVTASVGIAVFPDYGISAPGLLRKADAAMYAVKRSGRNGFQIVSEA